MLYMKPFTPIKRSQGPNLNSRAYPNIPKTKAMSGSLKVGRWRDKDGNLVLRDPS
jgi:hypothetical protein